MVVFSQDGFKQYTNKCISLVVENYLGVPFRDIGLPNLTPYLPEAVVMFIPLVQDACVVPPDNSSSLGNRGWRVLFYPP